jgi:hypothetical protein
MFTQIVITVSMALKPVHLPIQAQHPVRGDG